MRQKNKMTSLRLDPMTRLFITLSLIIVTFISCCGCAPWRPYDSYYAHPAVLQNAQMESRLSPHMRNPFYQDARTARALARFSWLGNGEMQVYTRDSEKIPRREIYNVLVHAGFIPRHPEHLQRL